MITADTFFSGKSAELADRRKRDDRADQERPGSRTCGDHRQAQPIGTGAAKRCRGGRARFRRDVMVRVFRSKDDLAGDHFALYTVAGVIMAVGSL